MMISPRGGFYSPRFPRGGGVRGRGRGARGRGFYGSNIDRRPTKILVTGFTAEEKEELIENFQVRILFSFFFKRIYDISFTALR